MKSNTPPTTDHVAVQPTNRLACQPCDLPPLCRNHYYTGKLLTSRDLLDEQRYQRDKLRLHHLALHGWGVVCGLQVKPHPYCPQLKLVITPGLAIDACGREIRVMEPTEIALPKLAPPPKPAPPCPSEPTAQGQPFAWDTESDPAQASPPNTAAPSNEAQETEECEPGYTLYVCLRYDECETEFQPAPFDECGCNQNGQQPNRICETFKLDIVTERPFADEDDCDVDDCRTLYQTAWEGCPTPRANACLLLAEIRDYRPGQPVLLQQIDNLTHRQQLPSVALLDRVLQCLLDKLPTRRLTHIEAISWTHRQKYHCHDFLRYYVSNEKTPQSFDITFEGPVRSEGITPRTFQAIAVRYEERNFGAGLPEIVPAKVTLSQDRTKASLYIDPEYARRRLGHTNFDLYIRLRCNLIVDDNGNAVDGNLLARLDPDGKYVDGPPTGDGLPGGLFESWIRVRTNIKESPTAA